MSRPANWKMAAQRGSLIIAMASCLGIIAGVMRASRLYDPQEKHETRFATTFNFVKLGVIPAEGFCGPIYLRRAQVAPFLQLSGGGRREFGATFPQGSSPSKGLLLVQPSNNRVSTEPWVRLVKTADPSGDSAKRSAVGTKTEIIPEIIVTAAEEPLLADGKDQALISVRLRAVRGSATWPFSEHNQDIVFNLEASNASFDPVQVRVPAGTHLSTTAKLTSRHAQVILVGCAPAQQYRGLAIRHSEPGKVEFIAPVNTIVIEPATNRVEASRAELFSIYLANRDDPSKKKLAPTRPVDIQLVSENDNGEVLEKVVRFDQNNFWTYAHYVGHRLGTDKILASASYAGLLPLHGSAERRISVPWWNLLGGLVGALIGSLVRSTGTGAAGRIRLFLESLGVGLAGCVVLIVYAPGANLAQINRFMQPLLALVLIFLISWLGPEGIRVILSFFPARNGQAQAN